MQRDPLDALLRLRRLAVDEARRALAESVCREAEADAAVTDFEAMIAREAEAASSLTTGDIEVEAFAAWLRRTRPMLRNAELARDHATGNAAQMRAVLSAARSAVRATEEIIAKHAATRRAEVERKAQKAIDEAAQRRQV